jgi:hypothetical protein
MPENIGFRRFRMRAIEKQLNIMAYDIIWEDNGVYWRYRGRVTGKEIVQASTSIYGDPRFITLKYKFVDFLEAESIDIDKDQLALIAYQHLAAERSNPYIKNAILIKTGASIVDDFAEYFNKSSWEIRVFYDRDEADQWVGR